MFIEHIRVKNSLNNLREWVDNISRSTNREKYYGSKEEGRKEVS